MSDRRTRSKRSAANLARQRAELILKVRSGLLTATAAAEQLGVSRKTYYQWEKRGLQGMLAALEDRPTGRPAKVVDREKEALKRRIGDLQKDLTLKEATLEIRELLQPREDIQAGSEGSGPARSRGRSGSGRKKKRRKRRPKR